jgi:hypothetical protein
MRRFHITGVVCHEGETVQVYLTSMQIASTGEMSADWATSSSDKQRAVFLAEGIANAVAQLLMDCGLCLVARPQGVLS